MASGRLQRSLTIITTVCLILLLNQGCIEHHYLYKFNLDGFCDFEYLAKGDSADIYDPSGSYPDELFFQVKTWTELDSAGQEFFLLEAKRRFSPDSLPENLGLKEVPWTEVYLQHPTRLVRIPLFFLNVYKFEGVFLGRNRTAIEGDRWLFIPAECQVLESGEDSLLSEAERAVLEEKYAAGLLIWNTERYKLRFREIIRKTLDLHPVAIAIPEEWVDSALAQVDSLIDNYASSLTVEDLDLINLEWWEDISPQANLILKENLSTLGDSVLLVELQNVGDLLELRHQVSEDLGDESFEVRVDLPGRVVQSSATTLDVGVLVWKFTGGDLAEDDFPMQALSIYIFPARVLGALVLILALYLGVKFKGGGNRKETAGPPPPPNTR